MGIDLEPATVPPIHYIKTNYILHLERSTIFYALNPLIMIIGNWS